MNNNVLRLYEIANSPERMIVGLMSGTSLDGLDVALCKFSGVGMNTKIELLAFATVPYDDDYKQEIASVFSKREVDLEKICLLNGWISRIHGQMVKQCLKKWNQPLAEVDLIASHGQTIYHAPKKLHNQSKFGNATLQLGDGDHLAIETGITTVSDFRQKHIAAGGEGAPLAAYGDFLIFSKRGEERIMLNIGGIANFTYLPSNLNVDKVFSTDTGPGNTLMDAFIRLHFSGKYFDENGALAARGKINEHLLKRLKDHSFFQQGFPKTTGPELFNLTYLQQAMAKSDTLDLSVEDTIATLNRFSAETIAEAILLTTKDKTDAVFYGSGGGIHNPVLMRNLAELLPGHKFLNTDVLHIDPDAKEAVLFAVLANESVSGNNLKFGEGKNGIPNVSMGKISFAY
ncbi:anhydro-N-acetylmuramic acid kinase [Olivibacter domesticus]|uniref:Anhydro-N-acetylmuramic acid kinase n=1 Tax=Olivibacter domesticus TaxID=407022 RepID=A0A1H7QVD8_OLID1|nr:anhydro-N-acetylmuramic acid kinase [Olivibacter domesticus]SEL51698.1 anhydro-N-acetylmuramic acid kinase [Olivibacter domesticus]